MSVTTTLAEYDRAREPTTLGECVCAMATMMTIFNETSHEWWQIRLRIDTQQDDMAMVVVLKDCDDWISSNTINNNNLVRPECTDGKRCCIDHGTMVQGYKQHSDGRMMIISASPKTSFCLVISMRRLGQQ